MMEYKGMLEVDEARGVIYFHGEESGITLLRIGQLPTPVPSNLGAKDKKGHLIQIDLVHMHGASYGEDDQTRVSKAKA